MIRPEKRISLLSKILLLDVLMVGVMLLLSVGLASRYSTAQLEQGQEHNLRNIAQLLATNESVILSLRHNTLLPDLAVYLDTALASQNNVDIITLADMNGIRLYHPDKTQIGHSFVGNDEGQALAGEAYCSKATGTLGFQMRYFYPVRDHNGTQLGFVMASILMSNLDVLRENVIRVHLQTLAIVFFVGAIAAALITLSIKRSLLGFEPEQIVTRFLQRGEIMDSMEESVIAIDASGIVILINSAAQELLGCTEKEAHGKDIDEVFPQGELKKSLRGLKDNNRSLTVRGESILCDRIPITSGELVIGVVAVMRGRTEVTRLAEQLTGVNHLLDALRANAHEFMNQLHVILGLLQSGNVEDAKRFIMDIGQVQGETVSALTKHFANRVLAALILGKINRCGELGIHMSLQKDSRFPRHSRFLNTKSLCTVVGNLVENAIDAIKERDDNGTKEITLLVHEDEKSLLITVDDSGVGLTAEEMQYIQEPGYSTKGEGRGTGLALIHSIVETYSGEFTIDSEKGVGSSMTLIFRKPRHLRPAIFNSVGAEHV